VFFSEVCVNDPEGRPRIVPVASEDFEGVFCALVSEPRPRLELGADLAKRFWEWVVQPTRG
jgi:hypothetical protein